MALNNGMKDEWADSAAATLWNVRPELLSTWESRVIAELAQAHGRHAPILKPYIAAILGCICDAVVVPEVPIHILERVAFDWDGLKAELERRGQHPFGTEDLIAEFQIFRGVVFASIASENMFLPKALCEVIGATIDAVTRDTVLDLLAADREWIDSCISECTHDARNPLNIASALAQLIERQCEDRNMAMLANRISEKIRETDEVLRKLNDGRVHGRPALEGAHHS